MHNCLVPGLRNLTAFKLKRWAPQFEKLTLIPTRWVHKMAHASRIQLFLRSLGPVVTPRASTVGDGGNANLQLAQTMCQRAYSGPLHASLQRFTNVLTARGGVPFHIQPLNQPISSLTNFHLEENLCSMASDSGTPDCVQHVSRLPPSNFCLPSVEVRIPQVIRRVDKIS